MLNILYGTAGTGKSAEVFRRLAGHAQEGTQAWLLVPEQFSMESERAVIHKLGVKAQNYIEVLSFSRLCNRVLNMTGPLRMQYIDQAGKLLLARRALQLCEKELVLLARNVRQKGFSDVLVSMIGECKRYGVTPEQLLRAAEQAEGRELGDKLRDLALLYTKYQELLTERFSDAEDNLSLILPKIPQCDFLQGNLYIHHFKSFTPVELEAVRQLMRKMDVTFVAECEDLQAADGVFASAAHTVRTLIQAAKDMESGIGSITALREEHKFGDKPDLLYLKQNFFSAAPKPFSGDVTSIHLIRPRNADQEVEECARRITELCRVKGFRMREILILARSLEDYESLIASTFPLYRIPFFMDQKRPISGTPLVRFLSALLECLAYSLSCERVMAMGRSGMLELAREELDEFENYLLASGVSHAMWNSTDPWAYNPDEKQFQMDTVNRVREILLAPVRKMRELCRGRKTIRGIASALLTCMEEWNLSERIHSLCTEFSAKGNLNLADEYRRVWNANLSLLAQIQDHFGEESATFLKFSELYLSLCGAVEVGTIPSALDCVTVSSIDRFRNEDAKAVFVLGVNDGIFPQAGAREGLLSDREREELLRQGLELAPAVFAKAQEEQTLVYRALTAPREELCLSYPAADKEGQGLLPSEIITKITKELFPQIQTFIPDEAKEETLIGAWFPTLDRLAGKLSAYGGEVAGMPVLWQTLYRYYSEQPDSRELLRHLRQIREQGEPRPLTARQVKRLYGEPLQISVTKLEKYNGCAYSFFLRYGLLAQPRLESGFAPNSMGSVLHEVLAEYFKQLDKQARDYRTVTKEECRAEVSALTRRLAAADQEILYQTSYYYKYMVMRMQGIASASAWEIVKFYRSSRFRPCGFEIKIGGTLPPLHIRTPHGAAQLTGFIDRADQAEVDGKTYYSVMDYKSSEKDMNEELAAAGIQIQPLVYAHALQDQARDSGTAAVLYMAMNDPIVPSASARRLSDDELEEQVHENIKIKGWLVDDRTVLNAIDSNAEQALEDKKKKKGTLLNNTLMNRQELDRHLEDAYSQVRNTTDKILSGCIEPKPYRSKAYDACRYCDYADICPLKEQAISAKGEKTEQD